jgi:hypothetical protein
MTGFVRRRTDSSAAEHTKMARANRRRISPRKSQKCHRQQFGATCQNQPSSTNKARTIVPPPQSARIMQRHIAGESIRQIAREERRDRATVTKIVRSDEMQVFVQKMRERFYGLIPEALATIDYALREQKDARIAYDILRDVGVAPHKGNPPQLPVTAAEDGYSRQAIMVANVLLESHQHMGVDLPEGVREALAKDSRECAEAAGTPGTTRPRLSDFRENRGSRSRTLRHRN